MKRAKPKDVKDRLLKANHNRPARTIPLRLDVKDRLLKANHNTVVGDPTSTPDVKDRLLKANHNLRLPTQIIPVMSKIVC